MDAALLYKMLKRRSKHVLSSIIKLQREDALFLYFVENDVRLAELTNEPDDDQNLPLDIAFSSKQLNIAQLLVEHKADINKLDKDGRSFVFKAVERGDVEACEFLASNGASMTYVNGVTGETLLHVLAGSETPADLLKWANKYIQQFDINAVDKHSRTPLFVAVEKENKPFLNLLVSQSNVNVNIPDLKGRTPLELALLEKKNLEFAGNLVENGADLNVADKEKQSLLHKAVREDNFAVIQFLTSKSANVNIVDSSNATPLHTYLMKVIPSSGITEQHSDILKLLVKAGADLSIRETTSGLTPLHLAVQKDSKVLEVILEAAPLGLPLGIVDDTGRTPFWAALEAAKFPAAQLLLRSGANINENTPQGTPILIKAIESKRDDIIRFLLDNKADAGVSSVEGASCLRLAVKNGLTSTVDRLCKLGAQLDLPDPETGLPPIWMALANDDYATASVLVANGCNMEGYSINSEGNCFESLLLRAVDANDQKAAAFLIKNGCDVNAVRRSIDGKSPPADMDLLQTALHLSVQWCLNDVTAALIANSKCKIDAQDSDGRTSAHFAVINDDEATLNLLLGHPDVSYLSVRDRYGLTPLALAMRQKNNKAAEAICKRLPHAALFVNGSGENLLHSVVKSNDFESVLFLLGLQTDVNIPVQNVEKTTALHIASEVGNEMIMRNLLLAGAEINAQTVDGLTPLHIAATSNHSDLVRILIENGGNPNIPDFDGNNALHYAVSKGSVESVKVLLIESDADPFSVNQKKQNILHLCAITIGPQAVEMFKTVLEIIPQYPLEIQDLYGNTMFLLSYINGNGDLCRLALRHGACLAATNHTGQSIFKIDTPTKQLLFGLLDNLESEPRWAEGDYCSDCESKFTITMRKHHCRHCGRLVCSKCSEHQIPIVKYNLQKNVRVCHMCFDVLTLGNSPTDAAFY
uniref:FYVE-type domain-containing protein n=1 Tax=Panagrolaimus superbus TaxID=310955 RepID=A0A914YGV6_9BILA